MIWSKDIHALRLFSWIVYSLPLKSVYPTNKV